jgi:hypothetical protein
MKASLRKLKLHCVNTSNFTASYCTNPAAIGWKGIEVGKDLQGRELLLLHETRV